MRDDLRLEWPIARTGDAWLTFGFDEDLKLSRDDALALASVVVDLRVTQLANKTLGVHAVLRDDALS